MKKPFIYMLITSLFLLSCGNGEGDSPFTVTYKNKSPELSAPSQENTIVSNAPVAENRIGLMDHLMPHELDELEFHPNLWEHIGTYYNDLFSDMAIDSSNNQYVVGYTSGAIPQSTSAGGYDAFVVKYNQYGTVQWIRQFGTSSHDYAKAVALSPDENYIYVVGYTYGSLGATNLGGTDIFITKIAIDNSSVQHYQYGTDQYDYAVAAEYTDKLHIAGYTNGAFLGFLNQGGYDAFYSKVLYYFPYFMIRNEQWGTSTNEYAQGMDVDDSHNVYVTGRTYGSLASTNLGSCDYFLSKYNVNGDEQFTKQWGTSTADFGRAVLNSGYLWVTGYTYGSLAETNAGGSDITLTKFDATSGNILEHFQYGGNLNDRVNAIQEDAYGQLKLFGETTSEDFLYHTPQGGYDALLLTVRQYGSLSGFICNWGFVSTTGDDIGINFKTDYLDLYYLVNSRGSVNSIQNQGGYDAYLGYGTASYCY